MGTNYYLTVSPCKHCGRADPDDVLHIGKSSAGWCFSLHVIPERGLNSLADWLNRFEIGEIRDEYGHSVTPTEMFDVITVRQGRDWDRAWDAFGYEGEEDFHAQNDSQRGPSGLLRHRIGRHCIGHADGAGKPDGTWDLIVGEFS